MRRLATIVLTMLVACGSSHDAPDAAHVITADAASDAAVPTTITLRVKGTPTLLACRDGSGAWISLPASAGDVDIAVTDDYEIVAVCTGSNGVFDAEEVASTYAEVSGAMITCDAGADPTGNVAVTGTMAQAGSVWMTTEDRSPTAAWSFSLSVPPGLRDFVAVDDDHVLIRRGQPIHTGGVESPVDVDANGFALVPVTLDVFEGAVNGATLTSETTFRGSNDVATISTTTGTSGTAIAQIMPPAALMGIEEQNLEIDQLEPGAIQFGNSPNNGSAAMPPVLTQVAVETSNGVTATWTAMLATSYDELQIELTTAGSTPSFQNVNASQGWVTAHHQSLTFDMSAPGYSDAWDISSTGDYHYYVGVNDSPGFDPYGSGISNDVTAALASRRMRAAHARR